MHITVSEKFHKLLTILMLIIVLKYCNLLLRGEKMLKDEKEKEKKNFKELNTKKKIEHIKEYYTIHIISAVIGIIFIYSLFNIWVINPPMKPFINLTIIGQVVDDEKADQLKEELNDRFPEYTNEKETILIDKTNVGNGKDPNVIMAMQTRLTAGIQTKDIDIIVADSNFIRQYGEMATFMDLEQVFTKEEFENISFDKMKLSIIERDSDDNVKKLAPHYYGIDVSSIKKLNELIYGDDVIVAIIVNSDKLEETKEVLKYLLEQK